MKAYSPYQFSCIRIYLGCYLLFVFLTGYSSAAETWSREGLVPRAEHNLTYGVFPNLLNSMDSPNGVRCFIIILSVFSFCFTLGLWRRWAAVLLWYGWACLLNRNNLTLNPAIHYTGWLLLACAIVPSGEPFSLSKRDPSWRLPKWIFIGAWVVLIVGYFTSGVDKFFSTSWMNGSAIRKIMIGPLGQNYNTALIAFLPAFVFKAINWFVIVAEIIALPLACFSKTRKWAWLLLGILQLGILLTMNLLPIVLGMIAIHFFLFDKSWFSRKSTEKEVQENPRIVNLAERITPG